MTIQNTLFLLFNCCTGEVKAIEIHYQAPKLNRDVGYELLGIYWDVLSRDILST